MSRSESRRKGDAGRSTAPSDWRFTEVGRSCENKRQLSSEFCGNGHRCWYCCLPGWRLERREVSHPGFSASSCQTLGRRGWPTPVSACGAWVSWCWSYSAFTCACGMSGCNTLRSTAGDLVAGVFRKKLSSMLGCGHVIACVTVLSANKVPV